VAEVDDLRNELATAEGLLADLPEVEACREACAHDLLEVTEQRAELTQRISALSARLRSLGG
jgi:chromosome segregation ATPase